MTHVQIYRRMTCYNDAKVTVNVYQLRSKRGDLIAKLDRDRVSFEKNIDAERC